MLNDDNQIHIIKTSPYYFVDSDVLKDMRQVLEELKTFDSQV